MPCPFWVLSQGDWDLRPHWTMHTAVSQRATEALPRASRAHAEHGSQFTLADSQQPLKKKKKKPMLLFMSSCWTRSLIKNYRFQEVILSDLKSSYLDKQKGPTI